MPEEVPLPEVSVVDAEGEPVPVAGLDVQPGHIRVILGVGRGEVDELTGLPSREAVLGALERRLARLDHDPTPAGVVVFDLDRFVERLDGADQAALLAGLARRLERTVRAGDLLGRWGADSFVLVFGAPTGEVEASVAAERLLGAIRGAGLTASAGMAFASRREPPTLLIEQARAAVELARVAGGDGVARFDPDAGPSADWVRRRTMDLRAAFELGQIELGYQPVVDLRAGQLVSGEALAVWRHPQEGRLTAGEFVPLAEATGIVSLLTDVVLGLAVDQLARWSTGLPDGIRVAINISATDVVRPGLADALLARCQRAGVPPRRLSVEITESVLIAEPERAVRTIAELRDAEVGVSLDDFGTGFASLSMLSRLPVDTLKIDRSFIADIATDDAAFAVVRLIAGVAAELGMSTIAEGIEDARQRDRAVAAGCRYGQGRYFAGALDPSEFVQMSCGTGPVRG